jgi:hypothetical protein
LEIAIEAERKLGKLILAAGKAGALAKAGRKKIGLKKTQLNTPTLRSAGVDKNLADRARKIGRLDEDDFAERFELWRRRYNGHNRERITTKLPALSCNCNKQQEVPNPRAFPTLVFCN